MKFKIAQQAKKSPSYKGPQMEEEDLSKTRNLFSSTLTTDASLIEEDDTAPADAREEGLVKW